MSALVSAWSRRRAAVAAETAAQDAAREQAAQDTAPPEKTDAEILQELGLPDPETLVAGDDFKAFMCKTVPAHLRRRALRKLWRSNPVLACVDGLNDYDDDYLTGSFGQDPIKTAYQVGKGMLAHLDRIAPPVDMAEPRPDVPVANPDPVAPEPVAPESVALAEAPDEVAPDQAAPARRMRFHFEDDQA